MDEHSPGDLGSNSQTSRSSKQLSENLKQVTELNKKILNYSDRTLRELEQLRTRIEDHQEVLGELAEEYGISFRDNGEKHSAELIRDSEERQQRQRSRGLGGL